MKGQRTFGTWARTDPATSATCTLELRCLRRDLRSRTRGCGPVADFMARFVAGGPGDTAPAVNALSTILNELVQNAAKFSADDDGPIEVVVRQHRTSVVIEVANVSVESRVEPLAEALAALARDDPEELFRRRVMGSEPGGLGLILLRKDYGADVGTRITHSGRGLCAIRVRVSVVLEPGNASRSEPAVSP